MLSSPSEGRSANKRQNRRVVRDCIKADRPTAASRPSRLPQGLPVPFDGSHRVSRQSAISRRPRRLAKRGSGTQSHPAHPGVVRRPFPAPSPTAATYLNSTSRYGEPPCYVRRRSEAFSKERDGDNSSGWPRHVPITPFNRPIFAYFWIQGRLRSWVRILASRLLTRARSRR